MSKTRYKYCVVPDCKNTTIRTPDKLFFSVPTGELRKKWCEVMGRDADKYKPLSAKCNRFCCEDHFNLEKDMDNYMQWKLVGTKKLFLKKGVVPHKFDCRSQLTETKPTHSDKERQDETSEQKQETQKIPKMKASKTKPKKLKQKKISELCTIEKKDMLQRIQVKQEPVKSVQENQDVQKYTFQIKVEAADEDEIENASLKELNCQNSYTTDVNSNQSVDVKVKVEQLDEDFKPILTEEQSYKAIETENTDEEKTRF